MAQTTKFNSNDTENGWIYNYYKEKIEKIETDMIELINTVEQAYSDMKISLNDYASLNKLIETKCSTELYNSHVSRNNLHVSSTEKARWDNKINPDEIDTILLNMDPDNGTVYEMNIIMKGTGQKTYVIPVRYNSKDR